VATKAQRCSRYITTLSLTSARDGMGDQRNAMAALPPRKTQYPLYRRLGGPQGQPGRLWKISPPPGFDPRTAQPVASLYTDWAIPAHMHALEGRLFLFATVCTPALRNCMTTDRISCLAFVTLYFIKLINVVTVIHCYVKYVVEIKNIAAATL
jgi:hypothetical protein